MSAPAARQGDVIIFRQPGPAMSHISSGSATVMIGGLPAACVGDAGVHGDTIASGSSTVLIGGRPAARIGDITSTGNFIGSGCPNVLIG
ncbi:PAAR domain-containing protein [Methylobacillus caricis]|uniref:PAAR domain-containing protein n=1 Tax=Methylobacillus caricis TaxID=1971611 RepID=UPI001CFFCEEC|nr:PAAR domain-containing protein [Methylobacillus caricis]MCB5187024.1 PAAR domain-containing protein [Methylobacillus caricis]